MTVNQWPGRGREGCLTNLVHKQVPVVLVHIGKAPAPWLSWNVRMLISTKPNPVVVVSDRLSILRAARRLGAHGIHWEDPSTRERLEASQSLEKRSFWRGFWVMTALRLEALARAHTAIGDVPIVHVENDVVLHPEAPLTWALQVGRGVALSRLGPGRSGAALLVSTQPACTRDLASHVIATMTSCSDLNEMQALDMYRRAVPARWETLPTSPTSHRDGFHDSLDHADRIDLSSSMHSFNGIFDVAGIGQYLLGSDPRGDRGRRHIFRPLQDQYVAVERWGFSQDVWGWPVATFGNEVAPVLSLHVHSKDKRAFDADLLPRLLRQRIALLPAPQMSEVSLRALRQLALLKARKSIAPW